MAEAKIFFHSNIRFLRNRKQFSQEEMAQTLGITRIKLQALESGKTVNPVVQDLIAFSEYFKISIDSLLKIDLSKLGELKLRDLEAGNDVYTTGRKLRVLAITVDRDNKENMEYVPIKAKAGYRSAYNDPEFVANLPKFSLPNLPKGATYRMFPTKGDSMLPIPEGSDVIATFVQDWSLIKAGTLCIVILKGTQDFVFKEVTVLGQELQLVSLNPEYAPYTVSLDEVLEIWQFYSFQSKELPKVGGDMEVVIKMLQRMRSEIQVLKAK
jgi:transcriptional regulator with XRE-family HTH domain